MLNRINANNVPLRIQKTIRAGIGFFMVRLRMPDLIGWNRIDGLVCLRQTETYFYIILEIYGFSFFKNRFMDI